MQRKLKLNILKHFVTRLWRRAAQLWEHVEAFLVRNEANIGAVSFVIALIAPLAAVYCLEAAEQEAEAKYHCFEEVTLANANKLDEGAAEAYINEACTYHEYKLDPKKAEVVITMVPYFLIEEVCGSEDVTACTKIQPLTGKTLYLMYIPHGSPGHLMHEMTHVIYNEKGVKPGETSHHMLMLEDGIYWVE